MSSPSAGPRSLGEWMQVLTHIEATLQQTLALAANPPAPPGERGEGALLGALRALDERLAHWQARLDLAERNAVEAGALVNAEGRALEEWAQATRGARERLAKCAVAGP